MSNLATTFLAIAIICLAASFIGRSSAIVDGLGKALFGVFMILFFMVRLFGGQKEA
jgi:uncharacterized membrane protein YtjA (UPF0391 family)